METAPLKSFATWARTALIREVTARIAVVLAPASRQRVEDPKAVAALEAAITAAGGGEKGRGAVADRVAYTWFNRIISLRFMDANGYTGIGVVSPQASVEVGQPEILAEAKRNNVDPEVVSSQIRESVSELLNGSRRSDDPQGEAYALLLVEYCRHWNRAMPFMFERHGDFTELLMPANLLADDSVLNRAVTVLTESVCRDVEVIGWLYQFYISERKDEVFAGFKKNRKAGADEIPAATQLFTPHWIVRYLVENSLGRLWVLNRPDSRLVEQMDYYIAPVEDETSFRKVNSPEELKVIDPACGSGHMLTYAFDLLYSIYEEEGYAPAEIPGCILSNNLYGTEIDPRAAALAAFAVTMKARARQRTFFNERFAPNICVLEAVSFEPDEEDRLRTASRGFADEELWNTFRHADVLGSLVRPSSELIRRFQAAVDYLAQQDSDLFDNDLVERASKVLVQAEYLSRRYDVAIANPPYMGVKNQDSCLSQFGKDAFPASKADLYAMFIERCVDLVTETGTVAMVTMHTWMFIASFEKFRAKLLEEAGIRQLAHLGTGAFDSIGGEVVSTVAFILSVGCNQSIVGTYLRLVAEKGEAAKRDKIRAAAKEPANSVYRRAQGTFASIPGAPIAYWLSDSFYRAFSDNPSLGDIATPRTGMRTGDNVRFLRQWSEVSWSCFSLPGVEEKPTEKWVVYAKGGPSRRWFGNVETVVNWANDGYEIKEETLRNYPQLSWDNLGWKISNEAYFFRRGVTWTDMSTTAFGARLLPAGCIFDAAGPSLFGEDSDALLGLLNTTTAFSVLTLLNPTLHFKNYNIGAIPIPAWGEIKPKLERLASKAVELVRADWEESETAWGFTSNPLLNWSGRGVGRLADCAEALQESHLARAVELKEVETRLNAVVVDAYGVDSVPVEVETSDLTLTFKPAGIGGATELISTYADDLVSYAVGCMFGRYSLDETGVILADQGASYHDYLARVQTPTFTPDADNVIPIVDGDWFEDDIVTRFRQFLRVAFGESHFEENLRFVTEALGVKDLREYFVKSFYKDHVQRYKKRPIYWLFSSPKGSFNALIYMHRYTPSTVSTVLNEYLREFNAKLEATLGQQERLAAGGGTPRQQAAAQKEADRIRKVLLELNEYEHDVLYPLASQQIEIDLDDGVKVNYPKFGAALKKIPGLETGE